MAQDQQRHILFYIVVIASVLAVVWFDYLAWLWLVGGVAGLLWATLRGFADDRRQSSKNRDFRS
jgi:hypothetical protein